VTVDSLLAKLDGVQREGKGWRGLCPAHDDHNPSLSVDVEDGRILLYCHAGCRIEDVVAKLGLTMADLFLDSRSRRKKPPRASEIVAAYEYRDEEGGLLFEVCRTRDKEFPVRRPDGHNGWMWGLGDTRRVLYRLPELLAAPSKRVYIVEGEKDADGLLHSGLLATTNPGGASTDSEKAVKWRPEYNECLCRRDVVILPDNDEAGREHGENVARNLRGIARSVKVLPLPNLPDKGDVSDWLAQGHTPEELEALAAQAPEWAPREGAKRFPLTDLGNAERLVAAHGASLRYHVNVGAWLRWTGAVWAPDDTGEVHRLAAQTVRAMAAEAEALESGAERDALVKHMLKSESAPRLAAAIDLAHWRPGVPVTAAELDRDPWLLNVLNGALDLRTGELRPHDPKDLMTKLAPVVYDPRARCPRWELFLAEVFNDDDLIAYAQRLAGYVLTGDTREQEVFFLVGKGSNGKTVLTETLRAMLGDYAKDTPFSTFLEHRDASTADLASLVGARLVTASEGTATQTFNEALLKRLSGGDVVTCRCLYREFFSYIPTFKILFATNEVPRIQSQTVASKRRVRIVPFRQTFYGPEDGKEPMRDEGLRDKLKAELPGILAWAVQGCLEWQRDGLRPPAVVMRETEALFESMDPLADFLEEECVLHPRAQVETGALYRRYAEWCNEGGRPRAFKTPTWFTRSLTQRDGVDVVRRYEGRFLLGIGLAAGGDELPMA